MHIYKFLPLLLVLFLCTCTSTPLSNHDRAPTPDADAAPATMEEVDSPTTETKALVTPTPTPMVDAPYKIEDGALMGMKIGEPLADFSAGLRAGILRTGEGDFDVLYIDAAEGDELGYLMADDEGITITDITITSPLVVTQHGLTVDMTYAQLEEKLSDFEVNGSEIEGYTHARADGYWYRLDAGNWSDEVDPKTLKPTTKILSISLPQ